MFFVKYKTPSRFWETPLNPSANARYASFLILKIMYSFPRESRTFESVSLHHRAVKFFRRACFATASVIRISRIILLRSRARTRSSFTGALRFHANTWRGQSSNKERRLRREFDGRGVHTRWISSCLKFPALWFLSRDSDRSWTRNVPRLEKWKHFLKADKEGGSSSV